ncbi:MAG: efflux RND transporter periplasmic adaptor subunit [Terricaulis sp.]|nr:efflux RND transporter periplasmic adaptor subunit [Terricaulis sp.]
MMSFRMKAAAAPLVLLLALGLAACGGGAAGEPAKAEHGHEEGHDDHAEGEGDHAEEDRVTIPAAAAEASRIVVAVAGPGALQETLTLTGRMTLQPAARAEIHAPYPGPVRAVLRNVGDTVGRGETLARVESAESLQTYAISSPIAGVVLDRQTNIGDVTADQPLFVVGDLSRLQAELNVATRDLARIARGQHVVIEGLDEGARAPSAHRQRVADGGCVLSNADCTRAPRGPGGRRIPAGDGGAGFGRSDGRAGCGRCAARCGADA